MLLRARPAAPPGFVEPCLPSRAEQPPSGPDWVHEIKHDGYRLMARRDPAGVRLLTRNGHDWAARYPLIVEAVDRLKVRSCRRRYSCRTMLGTSALSPGQGEGMRIQRRTLLAAGLTGMAWTATQGLAAASSTRTRFVFHVSSTWGNLLDWLVDRSYAPITAELEKRGFPSMLVHSSVRGSDTPNEDRASAVVKALQNVTDHVVIVGISNEGNFLPLVAAARPIRRVVYVNAVIPRPGKAFIEVCQTEQVAVPGSYLDHLLKASQSITDDFLKLMRNPNATKAQLKAMQERIDASSSAHTMVGFYEVCPLKALPKVDNVYVSGSADDQIRPEWEQSAARRVLGVEPVVISGAGHANIFTKAKYAAQLADVCVKGL